MRACLIIGGLLLLLWPLTVVADVMSLAAEMPPHEASVRYFAAIAFHYAWWGLLTYPVFYVVSLVASLTLRAKDKKGAAFGAAAVPLFVASLPFVLSMMYSLFRR